MEPATNPAAPRVERRAVAWLDESGLWADARERAKIIGSRGADFFARFAPGADDDRLLATALWVYWGFAFHDGRCDTGHFSIRPAEFVPMAARVQRALECPAPAARGDAYAVALQDIGARFRRLGTPVQFQRFVAAHRAWLTGVMWQVSFQARRHMPDLEDYVTMRLHSAGGAPTYAMLEIAHGAEVPAAEMDAPAVRALTEMAILTAALDDDRHSFAREVDVGRTDQNIYTVLLDQNGGDVRTAVRTAARLRDRVFLRFLRLRERTRPGLGEAGRAYLDGLAYGIRGNAEWGLRTPRRPDPDEPSAPVVWAERPADPGDEPVPLPSISWWWDL
nr:terpene synthase family protein [Actinomadura rayongensis]